jgi:arsenate reductase (thioredoxin)
MDYRVRKIMADRKKILALCTGNACRSQMLQGFLEQQGDLEVYSAGTDPKGVSRRAIAVMREIGIDISHHTSNHLGEYQHIPFDFVITVCDHAREACPFFPGGGARLHRSFPDPAEAAGTGDEVLDEFRRVRDMIRDYAEELLPAIRSGSGPGMEFILYNGYGGRNDV